MSIPTFFFPFVKCQDHSHTARWFNSSTPPPPPPRKLARVISPRGPPPGPPRVHFHSFGAQHHQQQQQEQTTKNLSHRCHQQRNMVYRDGEEDDRCSSNESTSPRSSKVSFDEPLLEDDDDSDREDVAALSKAPSPPRRLPTRSTSMYTRAPPTRSPPSRQSSSERMAEILGLKSGEDAPSRSKASPPRRRPPARSYSACISSTSSNARQPPARQRSGEQLTEMLRIREADTGGNAINRMACLQRQTSRRIMMDAPPSRPSRRLVSDSDDEDEDEDNIPGNYVQPPPSFTRKAPARAPSISRPVCS